MKLKLVFFPTYFIALALDVINSSIPFVVLPTIELSSVCPAIKRRWTASGSIKCNPGLTFNFGWCPPPVDDADDEFDDVVVVGVADGDVKSNVGIVIKFDNFDDSDIRDDLIWSPP